MDVSASQAQLHLHIGSLSLPVTALEGQEALSEPFKFQIDVLAEHGFSVTDNLGLPGVASIVGKDGSKRKFAGVVTALEETGSHHDGRRYVNVWLESRLALLRQQNDTRIILGKSVTEIVTELLQRHGFSPAQLQFHLTHTYPLRPYTLQAGETDLDFLQRILARAGIFYWSSVEEGVEVLHFSDHNTHLPFIARKIVRYQPAVGMETTHAAFEMTAIHSIELQQQMVAAEFLIHDRSENQPALAVAASKHSRYSSRGFQPRSEPFWHWRSRS